MSRRNYCELIDQVCEKLGSANSKSTPDACKLWVNEIAFTLLHGGEADNDSLYLYCDFGDPLAGRKALVSQHLMQTSLSLFGGNTPSFGFNAETGCAVLMNRMALSQTTLGSLMSVLVKVAAYVSMWRQSYASASSPLEPFDGSLNSTQAIA